MGLIFSTCFSANFHILQKLILLTEKRTFVIIYNGYMVIICLRTFFYFMKNEIAFFMCLAIHFLVKLQYFN